MKNNYLEILGITVGASKAEIKSAYRKLSKKYHPDINKNENAKESFIQINEAYRFLMDVGPAPNQETITYNYNPQDQAYAEWRQKAREYARNKAKEAQRQQEQQLTKLLYYFDFLAFIIFAFNLTLTLDYFLPRNNFEEKITKVEKVYEGSSQHDQNQRYEDLYFENAYLRVHKNGFKVGASAHVVFTSLYQIPLSAIVTAKGEEVKVNQVYSVYASYGFLIPLILLLCITYKRFLTNPDHKIAIAIALIMLFPLQLFLFLKF